MKRPIAAVLVLTMLLASCSGTRESRLNPFNWFKRSQEAPTLEPEEGFGATINDTRGLVDQVTAMVVERKPGGAIIRATGLPPTQGFFNAELVLQNNGKPVDGALIYEFRVAEPQTFERISTPQSREVTVAVFVSDISLQNVRAIQVVGAQNVRTSRR